MAPLAKASPEPQVKGKRAGSGKTKKKINEKSVNAAITDLPVDLTRDSLASIRLTIRGGLRFGLQGNAEPRSGPFAVLGTESTGERIYKRYPP